MKRSLRIGLVTTLIAASHAAIATAHPAPFSYIDIRLTADRVDVGVVAHIFDLSHDLQVDPQERLIEPAFLEQQHDAIVSLLGPRFQLKADGVALASRGWSAAQPLSDRQVVAIRESFALPKAPGVLSLHALMFPYDPAHQTFVNVYENDELRLQAILDAGKTELDYYPGSRQGTLAVARRFVPVGFGHILFGPEHLVFLVALLLLGGTIRQLTLLACAFVGGNAVALVLTILNVLHPPARIIEPAIALSIVYIGADNLMVRGGRDMRTAVAFAFGLIHGFWFANGLRASDLPSRTLGWSLISFDVGVELAQLIVVALAGSAILVVRAKSPGTARQLVTLGSVVAIVAGAYWFVQRVFFPGGFR